MTSSPPLLEVRNLRVEFPTRRGVLTALDDVSFSLNAGEILGVVGESGAGKSLTGAAIIGLLEPPGRIADGQIWLDGQRIDHLDEDAMRRIRGKKIGAIFQDPLTSLNPLYTVGRQLTETIVTHLPLSWAQARERAITWLEATGIPAARERIDHYPHQFSGGMRQRVVIALALAAEPRVIVADEPTTALDVSIQAQIIELLKRLCHEQGTAVVLITHDMGVIAETAHRVAVMYAGRLAEIGQVRDVIQSPSHPYTAGLMGAIPALDHPTERLVQIDGSMPRLDATVAGCAFHPRCTQAMAHCTRERPDLMPAGATQAACWLHAYQGNTPARSCTLPQPVQENPAARALPSEMAGSAHHMTDDTTSLVQAQDLSCRFDVSAPWLERALARKPRTWLHAVNHVTFSIQRGETLALVGESGCGKSTVARLLVGLYQPSTGHIRFDGQPLSRLHTDATLRKRLQMIFQDPYASLNPRWRVGRIIAEPLRVHTDMTPQQQQERVAALLEQVGLNASDQARYPHQFSGGQRQRISIARALAAQPEFLVCDEPTSALDVSVQAQVLNLMKDLQRTLGLTYLFISHNLAVVHHVADRIAVMYLGRVVELAPRDALFHAPQHPYTRMLLSAIPDMHGIGKQRTPVAGEVPNPLNPPSGCPFHPRCPHVHDRCRQEMPLMRAVGRVQVACHAVLDAT